jgi:riboflavin synthase
LIENIGKVRSVIGRGGGLELCVELGIVAEGTAVGDSIAVDGVCLTVSKLKSSEAVFDVSGETVSRSTLLELKCGDEVNLERAMSAAGRFGGHIVQGHVDGVGRISRIDKKGEFADFTVEADSSLLDEMVVKGSVAVDGISLTVAGLDSKSFTMSLIPVTVSETTWKNSRVSDRVNIETDIIIKTVKKQLERMTGTGGLTEEKLRGLGF